MSKSPENIRPQNPWADHPGLRGAGSPPESLLQAVWQQQRLKREQLATLDGQRVRVLHPGFKNHEAGPDFRNALISLGDGAPLSGDVEIDMRASDWAAHGHDDNPNFKKVVLHVIWEGQRVGAAGLPVLAMKGVLDSTLAELGASLGPDSLTELPENLRGHCSAPLRGLERDRLLRLLHEAAGYRWQNKARQFQARAKQAGWEQALWEGMFRALGYKQNVWPMHCLAELRRRWHGPESGVLECQARLFGISGLLPLDLSRSSRGADAYLRDIWDRWWRERDQFADCLLPRGLWRFNNLRPANHPQRRLALAAHWIAGKDLLSRLENWLKSDLPDSALSGTLFEILRVEEDAFWSWHWTFRSAKLSRRTPLLGEARVADLAVNVLLPWFWIRAVEGKNRELQEVAKRRYFAWPAGEDNSLLRLARQRLLGGASAGALPGAAAQQGLLHVLRDYCEHSNAICEDCKFPEIVRGFGVSAG